MMLATWLTLRRIVFACVICLAAISATFLAFVAGEEIRNSEKQRSVQFSAQFVEEHSRERVLDVGYLSAQASGSRQIVIVEFKDGERIRLVYCFLNRTTSTGGNTDSGHPIVVPGDVCSTFVRPDGEIGLRLVKEDERRPNSD